MTKQGRLDIGSSAARLDDGTRLAICGDADPFGTAISFLRNRGFEDGDRVIVSGTERTIGGVSVFCMTEVQHAPLAIAAAAVRARSAAKRKPRAKKEKAPQKRKAGAKKKSVRAATKRSSTTKRSSAKKRSTAGKRPASKKPASKKRSTRKQGAARRIR